MDMSGEPIASRNFARVLLSTFGLAFVLAAALYNEFLLRLIRPEPTLELHTIASIRWVQTRFLLVGIVLLVSSEVLIARIPRLYALTRRASVTQALLLVLPVSSLLLVLELGLRPFVGVDEPLTTIFMHDQKLGWRLRPNAHDVWGGVRVRINGKGLRGPELDYVKSPGVTRILYLGDSVTFGYRLQSHEQTFPYLIESILEDRLGFEVETVNAGVGGYSAWQEYAYLTTEGIKYEPDLIIVSFVLNDVTEKFGLVRFGGRGEGWQLQHAVSGDVERFLKQSSVVYLVSQLIARGRFGADVQLGAQRQERLDVEDLAKDPDRPFVRRAWSITLQELEEIYSFGEANDIPVMLVVFPFVFQFEDPDRLSMPQRVVTRHALEHGVPAIDLLPQLADQLQAEVRPQDLFLDQDHLTERGNRIVAQILADHLESLGLVTPANP